MPVAVVLYRPHPLSKPAEAFAKYPTAYLFCALLKDRICSWAVSTKHYHRCATTQAVANNRSLGFPIPPRQPLQLAQLAALYGAMRIAFLFTYNLRNVSASITPVSTSASAVAKFVYA